MSKTEFEMMVESFEDCARRAFCSPNLGNKNSCYVDPIIEDHWNAFQEGWEACATYMLWNKL